MSGTSVVGLRAQRAGRSMQWIGIFGIVALLVSSANAAGPSPAVDVTIVDSSPERIVIAYDVGEPSQDTLAIEGRKFSKFSLGEESPIMVAGAPELPNVCRSIIIPDDAAMAVHVLAADCYEIHDIDVAPSKGILLRTVNPQDVPHTFGEVYTTDAFYPGPLATLRDPYILRDHRGVVVDVNPLQYNPVTRTLRVYTNLTVEVVAVGPGTVNVLTRMREATELSLAFHQLYGRHFLNYAPGLRYTPLDESGNMLIICHDAWIPNVQALAAHKTARGISTTVVGVSTIGNNTTSIKNYIQNLYNTSDLAFVLLVGDVAQIATFSASGGASDPTYSKLAGSDDYPDIMVGRFSAETAAHVDTQVQRTIEYETMPATSQDWFWRGTGVASNQGPGDDGEYDNVHIGYIRNDLLAYGYTLVDQIYDPSGTAAQVSAALNSGRGIVNYCGHGSITSWGSTGFSVSNVNALTNDNMLPFICSVACNNGEFDGYTTCFAEAWMRATHGTEPTGAIGIYASSISQSWDPPMDAQDEFVDMYVAEAYSALGTLLYAGSCHMMDEYPVGHPSGAGVEMFDTWHLFGDPSLRVVMSCTDAGSITLDRTRYPCDGLATILVNDCGLNTSDAVIDTVTVTIASTTESAGESVLLTELDPAAAQFQGTIALSVTDAAGVLQVTEGDTITATYVDADDGAGGYNVQVTDTALVDCTPPTISNVQAIDIEPRVAAIAFDADEPALGRVHYGLSCGSLGSSATGSGYATSPVVGLAGLTDDTTYFYTVEAEDEAGNATIDDNGGACYSFTTPEVPDFFTELFEADNDLDNKTFTFTPNGSNDFYAGCVEPITELPTSPAGGTVLTMSVDDFKTITLSGGATVSLYGTSYTTFYPASNGYITFIHGELDYTESLSEHFAIPRISALYDDLNPSTSGGGSVSWKQLADRAVVTWQNVPEYSNTGSNTFQIEMFFDGTITISYLSISAADGLAGLSAGDGLDPDFLETDLTALGACGPKPPVAENGSESTPVYVPVTITLDASDDGLPDPPCALDYIITQLPAHGVLNDPVAGVIDAVPYTLANHGNAVGYAPDPCYRGADGFQFKVNDSGTAPEGGDSNLAAISINMTVSAGTPVLRHAFPMNSDPGWSRQGLWGFGQPTGGGTHNGDPSTGYTGPNVYGYNLYGDYTSNMASPRYLTSSALNCSSQISTQLRFRRWLGVEDADYDQATVEVSADGANWTTVWQNASDAPTSDSSWSLQSLNISSVADGQPSVYVRWGIGPTDGGVTYPGWNIDDVEIWAIPTPACDLNGDQTVDLFDFAVFSACLTGPEGDMGGGFGCGDLDGDGDVDLMDFSLLQKDFAR